MNDMALILAIGSFVFNGILSIAIWLMKVTYNDLKEQVKENRAAIDSVKDKAMQKEDFKDFRDELWARLNQIETRWSKELHALPPK